MIDTTSVYVLCALCDHFVELNLGDSPGIADYVHLDDGDKDHNHDAEPGLVSLTLDGWRRRRPDLFERDPLTGKIGPNR